jgi:predicted anti-sigma-YlaC factor YlaD
MNTECTTARDLIQRRCDGERLADLEQALLATHLAGCAACRGFAVDLERVTTLVERLPREQARRTFVAGVMQQVPIRPLEQARQREGSWQGRIGRSWAPMAGLLGLLVLAYQTVAIHGLSLLNLPGAIAEWAALVDITHLDSLMQATSLFAWSVGAELLLGISLVIVAVFAMMAQAIARPPALHATVRRRTI